MQLNLKYPVFVFQKNDDMVYVFFNERDLKSTNTLIFKDFDYKNVIHIDSFGSRYKIKNVFKVKYLGLWGFHPFLKGKQILVDFEYELEAEKVLLTDFKKEIIQRIERSKRIWQSGWDIDLLKKAVAESISFEEIANFLK